MKAQIKANELLAMQEFVSTDVSRYMMTGVNVGLNDKVTLRATDGHVAARMETNGEFEGEGNFTVKLSRDHVKMLKAVKSAPVELTVDGGFITVALGNDTTFKAELVDLSFPAMDRVFPESEKYSSVDYITLNVELLARFGKAKALLQGGKRNMGLKMEFTDNMSPAIIKFPEYDFEGLIMPMRD